MPAPDFGDDLFSKYLEDQHKDDVSVSILLFQSGCYREIKFIPDGSNSGSLMGRLLSGVWAGWEKWRQPDTSTSKKLLPPKWPNEQEKERVCGRLSSNNESPEERLPGWNCGSKSIQTEIEVVKKQEERPWLPLPLSTIGCIWLEAIGKKAQMMQSTRFSVSGYRTKKGREQTRDRERWWRIFSITVL